MIRIFFRRCGGSYPEQHAAAYELLCTAASLSGYGITGLELKKTPSGKPYFADSTGKEADFHFSISHSGNIAACAIGNIPCGIDVETKPVPERVMKRFFPDCTDKDEAITLRTIMESSGQLDVFVFLAVPDRELFFVSFKKDGFTLTVCTEKDERVVFF